MSSPNRRAQGPDREAQDHEGIPGELVEGADHLEHEEVGKGQQPRGSVLRIEQHLPVPGHDFHQAPMPAVPLLVQPPQAFGDLGPAVRRGGVPYPVLPPGLPHPPDQADDQLHVLPHGVPLELPPPRKVAPDLQHPVPPEESEGPGDD